MTGVAHANGVDDRQASSNGPLSVVLMRGRVAEIDEQAIAEVLGDVPVEPCNYIGTDRLVRSYVLAQFFGVETASEGRRADEIAEHHGEVSALRRSR
jgi:hypothetical protein